MTTLQAPPLDLAPVIASTRVDDFPVPNGREEEWRFSPIRELGAFFEPDDAAGSVVAEPAQYVTMTDTELSDAGHWTPVDRAAAVALAGARRTIRVDVPADTIVEHPIVVTLRGEAARNHAHIVVRVGHHSRATVVIAHDLARDVSGAIVTEIGDSADLTMLSVMDGADTSTQLWHWPVLVGRDATFLGSTVTIGGRIVRMLPSATYAGPGGSATLLGAFLAEGGQFIEHRILVEHEAPHCTSSVIYKGALSGTGTHTVWVGDVVVRRDAVDTDTYEMNRNLLLDDGARADSVPNLELETGNVASAGHASATGRFDDQQLFYLQARGIPERVARQLVVRGFFVDVLNRVGSTEWRDRLLSRIAQRLGMDEDIETVLEESS